MLNKSIQDNVITCSSKFDKNISSQMNQSNGSNKNGSDKTKNNRSILRKNKLNSILNRTLSDSILNKKSTSLSHTFQPHKRDLCLSRKNSTNRRSILFNHCSNPLNTSNNTGYATPSSPSFLQAQSPNTHLFGLSQYNYRNKLKYHRSSWCVINNNLLNNLNTSQNDSNNPVTISNNINLNENSSFPSSLGSSLSPSPITILNNHSSNSNLNSIKNGNKPISSPKLQLTPATSVAPSNLSVTNQGSLSLSVKNLDTRRWSFASINSTSSSGYGGGSNTPPILTSLPPNFQQSDKQSTSIPICSSSSNIVTDNSNPSSYNSLNEKNLISKHQSFNEKSLKSNEEQTSKRQNIFERRSRLSSSNESSHLDDSSDVGFSSPISYHRQRARSLSCSPSKGLNESEMVPNEIFKEKFPKACKQLEENLQLFIDLNKIDLNTSTCSMGSNENQNNSSNSKNSKYYVSQPSSLDPAARFIQNQVIEIAKLCLEKSKSNQLTCSYLDEMTSSLEKLLLEARDKCCQVELSVEYLHKFIKKFLFIISHVARLLECIEFDPLEFSHFLDCAEQQAKQQEIKTDIPKYIISKLGIDRDPIKELNNEEEIIHSLNRTNSITSTTSTSGFSGDEAISSDFSISSNKNDPNQASIVPPSEDDFEEVKLISNGAYGAVYLVRHKMLGHRFAMKKIKKQNLILRNQIQQVFTERDIMTFTDNPFVVALICTFETKKHLCMVMEYVEGGDVATLIKNMGPLPLDMARTYFAEATLAVEYLHNYGIIHRDLKPDNLLITSLGHIKLTDFGLSKIGLMNLTTNFFEDDNFMKDLYCKEFNDKQICGTPQYLAPEVILRQSYGKTVDWWSMGIILYEFFTSIAPFNGNTPEDLFSNVINGEICWPDDEDEIIQIPEDAKNLILGLLTHDPIKRLGANGAIEIKQHPFFNFLDWNNLLRIKAEFIPQLDGPDDTSYFDTRSERYNHDADSGNNSPYPSSSFLPIEQPMYKVESGSCLNRQTSNEDKVLTELLNKKLMLSETNEKTDGLNSDDDTDNELFASFSSCSSKFRLSSISNNNSPVLFMNESGNNSIRLNNLDTGSNISISSLNNRNSLISSNSSSRNHLIDDNFKMPKFASLPIETEKNTILENSIKNSKLDNGKKYVNNKDSLSSNTSTLVDPKEAKIESYKNSAETIKSNSSTQVLTPTTPTSTNNKLKQFLQSNQQKSSNLTQLITKSVKESKETKEIKETSKNVQSNNNLKIKSNETVQAVQSNKTNQTISNNTNKNNQCKINRWFSAIVPNSSKSNLSNSNLIKKESGSVQVQSSKQSNNSSSKSNFKENKDEFKKPFINDSVPNHLTKTNKPNKTISTNQQPTIQIPFQYAPNNISQNNIQHNTNYPNYNQYLFPIMKPQVQINEYLPLTEMIQTGLKNSKIVIKRSSRGFGFVIRTIKVFYGDSDFYTIQHLVVQIDDQGPALFSGLKINDIITHVNDEVVCGKMHSEVARLIMSSVNNTLYLNSVPFDQTNIKTGGRKRSPSRSKLAGSYATTQPQYFNTQNYSLMRQYNNPKQINNIYYQNYNQAYYNSQEQYFNNNLYAISSNPSTTHSSSSSLVSDSGRRSLGAYNEYNSYQHYNGSLLQTAHPIPNYNPHQVYQPQQVAHQLHVNNSQTFIPPSQPVQQERKKKSCLLRKLSERYANAHKSELQRLQQNLTHHSSSSSSSSSSLNNSFSVKTYGNFSPKLSSQLNNPPSQQNLTSLRKETDGSLRTLRKIK